MKHNDINRGCKKCLVRISLVALLVFTFLGFADAAGISNTAKWAWSDKGGWINFNPTNGNVDVSDSSLTGQIWSTNFGWINLQPTNGGVTNNCNGQLSGYAWGPNSGWINFNGTSIDPSNGVFSGSASSLTLGTLYFSGQNISVITDWRCSSSSSSSSSRSSWSNRDSDGDGKINREEGIYADKDADGIADYLESDKIDSDNDGVDDERDAENYNPDNDSDADGYSNKEEKEAGTDPTDPGSYPYKDDGDNGDDSNDNDDDGKDTDGDGYTDAQEKTRGTDPNNPNSNPGIGADELNTRKCPIFTKYLKRGDSGEEVRKMQIFLKQRGYYNYDITGFYGNITDRAVRAFQAAYADDILKPWGISTPTGRWFKTSRYTANKLAGCFEDKPVLAGEQEEQEKVQEESQQDAQGQEQNSQTEQDKNTQKQIDQLLDTNNCSFFTRYHRKGESGGEISKIQAFLKKFGYYRYPEITGYYGPITDRAVRAFQAAYADDILKPWGMTQPSGWWYKTTRAKANELAGCKENLYLDNLR